MKIYSVIYGPSTENKIERWWRELLDRMERFFKVQLNQLLEDGSYERDNKLHRDLLAFVYIPVVQKELDLFRENVWNSHRGGKKSPKNFQLVYQTTFTAFQSIMEVKNVVFPSLKNS
ncbi:hypothetical protein OS493_036135 [Desmophyllum pertusum]|uniref:Integrase core domain-containing protein n=1 Tax=Desmophyllum pertusum TaxID=174260 RepID=A0A9W9YAP7_9CNID|nr:hypothetical protein OS493_036135 [Desmophyllum pertusum]